MSSPWPKRIAGWAVDLLAIFGVLWIRLQAWPTGQSSPPVRGLSGVPEWAWEWASPGDLVLFGPDAGNWAANAQAMLSGHPLDPNRLPVYSALTAMAAPAGDVVLGGHLVNHVASAGTCLVLYWLGVMSSGRGPALGAALFVAATPGLIASQTLYGVDPSFALFFLLSVATTWWAMTGPWWGFVLAGVSMGLLAGTHYLGVPFPLVLCLGMLLAEGDWRRRTGPALGALLTAALTLHLLLLPYESLGLSQLVSVYSEGMATPTAGAEAALAEPLSERLVSAPRLAIQRALVPLRAGGLPWASLVGLLWVGVVGWGLPGRPSRPGQSRPWDWRAGLWLLVLCGPLILLEATRAPERYRDFLRPLVVLLVMRGLGVLGAAIDHALRTKLPRWPKGWVAVALCGGVAWWSLSGLMSQWPARPSVEQALHERATGLAVSKLVPTSVVTSVQVVAFYSGAKACPGNYCGADEQALASCKRLILRQCPGDPIVVVVDHMGQGAASQAPNRIFDAWVESNFEPERRVSGLMGGRSSALYVLPRAALSPQQ